MLLPKEAVHRLLDLLEDDMNAMYDYMVGSTNEEPWTVFDPDNWLSYSQAMYDLRKYIESIEGKKQKKKA